MAASAGSAVTFTVNCAVVYLVSFAVGMRIAVGKLFSPAASGAEFSVKLMICLHDSSRIPPHRSTLAIDQFALSKRMGCRQWFGLGLMYQSVLLFGLRRPKGNGSDDGELCIRE
jgi:hypothetical protein